MGDRPKASNGKQHVFWGTLRGCPSCGRCLCFACHPDGPCVDDRDRDCAPACRRTDAAASLADRRPLAV